MLLMLVGMGLCVLTVKERAEIEEKRLLYFWLEGLVSYGSQVCGFFIFGDVFWERKSLVKI